MASHRRRGVLVRALRLRRSPSQAVIPVPRQRSIELVDGRTRVAHRVSPIDAICEVHQRSGRLVVRREGDRIVLDGHADECCVIVLEGAAVTLLFDVLGELV